MPPELKKKDTESSDEDEGILYFQHFKLPSSFDFRKDIHMLKYTFAREDTLEIEYKPKNDMYGIGFDPYTAAPEFRDRKGI